MQPESHQFNCSLKSEAAVLVKHTPVQRIAIQTDVTVEDTQTHNLIARFTNQVDVKVEVIRDSLRGRDLHGLKLLKDDSSDSGSPKDKSFNNVHVFVQVFVVVNFLKFHDQIISRGKRFGQLHCGAKIIQLTL